MPTTTAGQVVGGIEMVLGVSFIAFLTAGVTSTVIHRGGTAAAEAERAREERSTQRIIDALSETRTAIAELETRLGQIEARLADCVVATTCRRLSAKSRISAHAAAAAWPSLYEQEREVLRVANRGADKEWRRQ